MVDHAPNRAGGRQLFPFAARSPGWRRKGPLLRTVCAKAIQSQRLDPGVTEYKFKIGQMPFGEVPETLGK
jgi:hypothetical protein